jgi:hypothetical protein
MEGAHLDQAGGWDQRHELGPDACRQLLCGLRLNVATAIRSGRTPLSSSTPSRAISVVVFPLPAGAMIRAGPSDTRCPLLGIERLEQALS